MKLKINGVLFEVVLSFVTPGSLAPWQAEAVRRIDPHEDEFFVTVASGTTPDTAITALALELSEVY